MKISVIGSSFEAKLDESLLNTVSLAGGFICLAYLVYTIPAGFIQYSIANTVTGALCFGVYFLNRLRFYNPAFWIFALVIPLFMVGYTLLFGMINAELYLISGGVFISFLINKRKHWSEFIWAFVITAFLFCKAYLFFSGQLGHLNELESLLFLPNATAAILLVYLAARIFKTRQEQQRKELDDANKLKEKLLSVLSHDIRSPLNSLKGVLELHEDGEIRHDQIDDFLVKIKNEVTRTSDFVENLLLWIKQQMKGLNGEISEIDLSRLINETLEHLHIEIEKKHISVNFDHKQPAIVYSDLNMLKVIIRNLLSNAIKFTFKNTGVIDINLKQDGQRTIIDITDNGIGMGEDILASLFKLDHKSIEGTGKEKGHGLGLQLVKGFADHLGIAISVKSAPNIGTTFSLYLDQSNHK